MIPIEDIDSNHTKVVHCKTHFCHGFNLGRCPLIKDDRPMIAGKIAEGVTFDRILDDIRDEVKNLYDVKIFTTRRNLLNVQRDFNLTNLIDVAVTSLIILA